MLAADGGPHRLRRRRHGDAARPAAAAGRRPWPTTTSRSARGSSPTAPTCARASRRTGGCSGRAFHAPGVGLGRRPGPGHAVRVQGLHAGGRPGPLRAPADHEHRVRRRAHLPRPPPRLPAGHRPDPLVRPARLADARRPGLALRVAWDLFRIPLDPPRRRPGRRPVVVTSPRSLRAPAGAGRRCPSSPIVVFARRGRGDPRGRRRHARLRLPRVSPGRGPPPRRPAAVYDLGFEASGGVRALLLPADLRAVHAAVRPALGDDGRLGLDGAADRGVRCSGSPSCPCRRPSAGGSCLLAGLSWPFVYAVKLGQVGPAAVPAFAIGWRWLDDPVRLGAGTGARGGHQAPARPRPRLGAR